MGAFLKTHAVSVAIHAALVAIVLLLLPRANQASEPKKKAIEFEVIKEPAAKAPPPPPVKVVPPIPTEPRPAVVPDKVKVAMVDKAKPFQDKARPDVGTKDAPDDAAAVPAATTPLPNVDMEATVVGTETEYVTTSETGGTMGVRKGSGAPGGTGGGQGTQGPTAGQGSIEARVSPDWEITRQPEPLNDRDFDPDYPTLAKREARDGTVVVQLWIDEHTDPRTGYGDLTC